MAQAVKHVLFCRSSRTPGRGCCRRSSVYRIAESVINRFGSRRLGDILYRVFPCARLHAGRGDERVYDPVIFIIRDIFRDHDLRQHPVSVSQSVIAYGAAVVVIHCLGLFYGYFAMQSERRYARWVFGVYNLAEFIKACAVLRLGVTQGVSVSVIFYVRPVDAGCGAAFSQPSLDLAISNDSVIGAILTIHALCRAGFV